MKEACSKIVLNQKDVEGKWNDFKDLVNSIISSKVPSKMASNKKNTLPFLSKSDIKKIKKKHKLYKKARGAGTT